MNTFLNDLVKQHERKIIRDVLIKALRVEEPKLSDYNSVFTMPSKPYDPMCRELWYKNDRIGSLKYETQYNSDTMSHCLTISFIPKNK